MSTQPKPFITPEQYMDMEAAAPFKSEYRNGKIFRRPACSTEHNLIASRLLGTLGNVLRGRGHRWFGSDMMVLVETTGLRTYPDISGTCEPIRTTREAIGVLLNPTFIIEILSPETEAYDRGEKFEHYVKIPTLREYVMVSSDRQNIDMYRRRLDGSWLVETNLETVALHSVGIEFPTADAYELLSL